MESFAEKKRHRMKSQKKGVVVGVAKVAMWYRFHFHQRTVVVEQTKRSIRLRLDLVSQAETSNVQGWSERM